MSEMIVKLTLQEAPTPPSLSKAPPTPVSEEEATGADVVVAAQRGSTVNVPLISSLVSPGRPPARSGRAWCGSRQGDAAKVTLVVEKALKEAIT
jgi:hypothetical protein